MKSTMKAYPNPVKKLLNLSYNLHENTNVSVDVYDVKGQIVDAIDFGGQNAGIQKVMIDFSQKPSGVYFLRLRGNNFSLQQRIVKY